VCIANLLKPTMRGFHAFCFLLFLSSRCIGAQTAKPAAHKTAVARPNIILITLDTTRADRMGFLGSNRGLTPNLDALAKHSVVFTRAYAQVPLTTPSHAALLTGTYPQYNRVEDLGSPLLPDLPYLPDLLHREGYHTAAFVGAMVLDPASGAPGFDRGFEVYDANFHNSRPGEDIHQSIERRGEDVANRAMGWLSHHQQPPFFLWLHFYDPHEPYDPPEPFKSHFASDSYDGEIAYVDSVVGSVLEVLERHDLFRNTVIAVAADHGEAFGEHGERWHGMFLYDETIHVPLLLKLPDERFAAKRIQARVALADITPTLLQLVRIAVPATVQGQSLMPLMDVPAAPLHDEGGTKQQKLADRPIYSESNYAHRAFGWSELRSWRVQKYLYVQAPKKELYDESTDPNALKNLAGATAAVTDTLDNQVSDFTKRTSSAVVVNAELNPAQEESLRALGYLGSSSGVSNSREKASIDPKDKIGFVNGLHDALSDEKPYDSALPKVQELARHYESEAGRIYFEFGKTLIRRERFEQAASALRIAAEKLPESGEAHYELGLALIKSDQWEAALPEFQAAVERKPGSAQFHFYLAGAQTHLKHLPEATKEYEKALQLDPNHFQANLTYGHLLLLEGNTEAAVPRLIKAVQVDPQSAEAHGYLADAYERLGKVQDSERERSKAIELKGSPE
jgi:arylsulfatase A-like enzyme/Flp pilus assembly protein TadD